MVGPVKVLTFHVFSYDFSSNSFPPFPLGARGNYVRVLLCSSGNCINLPLGHKKSHDNLNFLYHVYLVLGIFLGQLSAKTNSTARAPLTPAFNHDVPYSHNVVRDPM